MKLCSAVLPTRGRAELARLAVDCFLSQTYHEKELVILDDFDTPSFPNGITHPLIRYYQTENIIFNIPVKRNRVNALAKGECIFHVDSDDWSAPNRMGDQVHRLEQTGLAVTGYHEMLFIDEERGKVFEYRIKPHYVCGSSLAYLKSFWERNKFPESSTTGSDNRFVRAAREQNQLDCVPGLQSLVARIHSGNTNRAARKDNYYEVSPDRIPAGFPRMVTVG